MNTENRGQLLAWLVIVTVTASLVTLGYTLFVLRPQVLAFLTSLPLPTPAPFIIRPSPTPSPTASPLASPSANLFTVQRVIDGDTIELSTGQTVRYIGMDTPETKHPTKGQECFGREASERNRQLVEGKSVRLEKDVSEVDRYGRLLRYVWMGDQLVNQLLVAEGYAFARSFPPDITKQAELFQAEQTARSQNLGLWAVCQPEL